MTRKKIGLAFSGGGARGFAHIGVLKVLVENGISIDLIAGTSAGSIIGGAYAAGMSVDQITAMAAKVGWLKMMRPSVPFSGLLSNAPMGRFLKKQLPVALIEDTPIPFAAVAFDLANSETVVIREGDLITAIRASCSVPGIFAPVRDEHGRTLVDGGVVSPIPVDVVRAMGADIVIGVDLISCGATFRTNSRSGIGIVIQSALALLRAASVREQTGADLVIEPQIAHLRPDQINKREEFIVLGEKAAQNALEKIRDLIQ